MSFSQYNCWFSCSSSQPFWKSFRKMSWQILRSEQTSQSQYIVSKEEVCDRTHSVCFGVEVRPKWSKPISNHSYESACSRWSSGRSQSASRYAHSQDYRDAHLSQSACGLSPSLAAMTSVVVPYSSVPQICADRRISDE